MNKAKINIITSNPSIREVGDLCANLSENKVDVNLMSSNFTLQHIVSTNFQDKLFNCDLLYYRTGFGYAGRHYLSKILQSKNVQVVNKNYVCNTQSTSKYFQSIQMHKAGLSHLLPTTLIGKQAYEDVVDKLGQLFVVKAALGIQGKAVFLVQNKEQYEAALAKISGDVVIQRFVENSGDFRVFIIGGVVVGMCKRSPLDGDFRSNIAQGATGAPVMDGETRQKLSDVALACCGAMGFDIAGIDIVFDEKDKSYFFLEANANPGWAGLENATGSNITNKISEYFLSLI